MMDNYNAGASQFAGGGFMPSQGNTDAAGFNSPAQRRAGSQNQTLRAVTIKQLFDGAQQSSDDMHMVDGQEIQNVTLVGKLVSCQELSTQLKFGLDDGTGTVEVCYWIDTDEGDTLAQKKAAWRVGAYVRVHGNMRTFDSRRTIVAFNIRAILDFNEVTYHLLNCIFQHAYFAKGSGMGRTDASLGMPTQPQHQPSMQNGFGGGGTGFSSGFGGGMANGSAGTGDQGLNALQQAVAGIFNSPEAHGSQGITADQVANKLAGRFSISQVRDAVRFLVEEGHLYTTSDEEHFKYSGHQ